MVIFTLHDDLSKGSITVLVNGTLRNGLIDPQGGVLITRPLRENFADALQAGVAAR